MKTRCNNTYKGAWCKNGSYELVIQKLLWMYSGVEQMNKSVVDDGSQASHCWKGKLQMSQEGDGRLEWTSTGLKVDHQYQTVFNLIKIKMDSTEVIIDIYNPYM